jgi:hypothetical protein
MENFVYDSGGGVYDMRFPMVICSSLGNAPGWFLSVAVEGGLGVGIEVEV